MNAMPKSTLLPANNPKNQGFKDCCMTLLLTPGKTQKYLTVIVQ